MDSILIKIVIVCTLMLSLYLFYDSIFMDDFVKSITRILIKISPFIYKKLIEIINKIKNLF